MEQRCHLSMVWLTWLGLPALAVLIGWVQGWVAGIIVLGVGVIAQASYVRWFPWVSRWLGYGSVADVLADTGPAPERLPRVTLYTANVCPFCPIIRRRLDYLRQDMGFELEEVDVSFRPQVVRAKGLRSVPVVEANGRFLVGNATSATLSSFLKQAANAGPTAA